MNHMSAPPSRVPRASGEATVVRARMTARERLARIIQRRELLVGMVRNELKIKYKNSVLGFAWSLLNPLLYLVVFYIAFTIILGSGIPAFPIWLLSGLLVWNLFSTGLGAATGSVVANSGLVKKVSFPREILPLAAVGSMLVHFFLQSMVLFVVLAIVRWDLAWAYVPLIPLALAVLLLLTSALGILLSAINVYLRDTSHFLELALLAWFWVTPIVYQFQLVGLRHGWSRWPWFANPVTPIVLIFQRAIYARLDNVHTANGIRSVTPLLPHWPYWAFLAYLGYSLAFAVVTLAIAVRVFGRSEANFAEEL
ncbi:MAG: type transport system permease protein [Actinomycetota bacterium]|nr:type transport system permease protein [Actinomycetota bacterium]